MKNLSAIPRLSLFVAFTILIIFVVSWAGFTKAEVKPNNQKDDVNHLIGEEIFERQPLLNDAVSNSARKLKGRDDFLISQLINSADSVKNFNLADDAKKVKKRNSEIFDNEFEAVDEEADADGYGYDDDEYYHFNIKRNDEASSAESSKSVPGGSKKEMSHPQISSGVSKNINERDKDSEKIEMISFNESHFMPSGEENSLKNEFSKPVMSDLGHNKKPAGPLDGIKMSDLKENSAIDEKVKDKKDELAETSKNAPANDSKLSDQKKTVNLNEDKDTSTVKEAKFAEEAEKKEKEVSVKEVSKDTVTNKNVKETVKNVEDKSDSKNPKASENSKSGENVEKISEKEKDGSNEKVANVEKNPTKVLNEENPHMIRPNEISQINSRATFASNNYKDNGNTFNTADIQEDDKYWEELNENNYGSKDYQDDIIQRGQYSRDESGNVNYEDQNNEDCVAEVSQEPGSKMNGYVAVPTALEMQDEGFNNYYKKQSGRNEEEKIQPQRYSPMQRPLSQGYHFNFPPNELENTDYHKNYVKSLKQYKSYENPTKYSTMEPPIENSTNTIPEKIKSRKKKRSKLKKRKSISIDDFDRRQLNSKTFKPKKNLYANLNVFEQPEFWLRQARFYDLIPNSDPSLAEDKKCEIQRHSNRGRRKSQPKVEYEIKIINQNKQDTGGTPFLRGTRRRRKKDVKSYEKYPCSQVSPDDVSTFKKTKENFFERIFKRKAPLWKRNQLNKQNEGNSGKSKGAPSGYYGNRVKFGQKHNAVKNDEQFRAEDVSIKDRASSFSNKKPLTESDNNYLQRSWRDSKIQEVIHDPDKRYDENAILNKQHENSLLLLKKDRNGDKIANTFLDQNNRDNESNLSSEQLAKILSKDNDYIVLKKTENNKFQKIENDDLLNGQSPSEDLTLKQYDIFGLNKQDSIKDDTSRNRGVLLRPHRSNDPKLYSSESKSNLKKTFEKFKDLADFFKDNEQGAMESQQSIHEPKEKNEIVFSEDKLPDPVVLNGNTEDFNEKAVNVKQKSPNIISSISNNFKKLDQGKKMEAIKLDEPCKDQPNSDKPDWEPFLKNAFPEAKSINLMKKNGNEIIVLDFDRNQMKTNQGNRVIFSKAPYDEDLGQLSVPLASVGPSPRSMAIPNNRQVEIVLNEGSLPTFLEPKLNKMGEKKMDKQNKLSSNDQEGTFSILNSPTGPPILTLPLNQLSQLPYLLKQTPDKAPNKMGHNYKEIVKKGANFPLTDFKIFDNFSQPVQEYQELSEINTESPNKKENLYEKRRSSEIISLRDPNEGQLGDPLQSVSDNDNVDTLTEEDVKLEAPRNANLTHSEKWLSNSDDYDGTSLATLQKHWASSEDEDAKDKKAESDYQSSLWQELAATSNKIQRLRREGATESKLRQIIEEVLPLRGKRWSENDVDGNAVTGKFISADDLKVEESDKNPLSSLDLEKEKSDEKNEFSFQSRLEPTNKRNSPSEKFSPSENENNIEDFIKSVNINGAQTDNLSLSENLNDGRTNWRVKRSPDEGDSEKKVSNSQVKNLIFKNFQEENYQSVYSPEINRKLLSIDDEMKIPDDFDFADKSPSKCVRNARNKCINPDILNLFRGDESESSQNRARRSVFGSSHSNYKREIDLDESMPNDFQNFLVTSLGLNSQVTGFGAGKKREVDKKDGVFWETKESFDNDHKESDENSIGKKNSVEDSALEKREVSNQETPKRKNFKENLSYLEKRSDVKKLQPNSMETANHSEMKAQLRDKSPVKSKASQYEETKVPTQIRIQITKASSKEKKSSKPTLEENEASSNDIDIPSRNFESEKTSPVHLSNSQKSQQNSNSKHKFSDNLESRESSENDNTKKHYVLTRPMRRGTRRKKKKYIQENPMKPVNDFMSFDQKSMEILMRKYFEDQNLQKNANQKMPASNHLPQVETVYNPSQVTNKAQVHDYKPLFKVNSLSDKNSAASKSGIESNEVSDFDEEFMRSYLKEKSATQSKNTNKETSKEFEDVDWKPYTSLMKMKTDLNQNPSAGSRTYKTFEMETDPDNGKTEFNIMRKPSPSQWYQAPYTYNPSEYSFGLNNPTLRDNSNIQNWNLYDKDNAIANWIKYSNYLDALPYYKETKETIGKAENRQTDDSWTEPESEIIKNQKFGDKYQFKNYFRTAPKTELDEESKNRYFPYKYMQLFEEDKPAVSDPFRYGASKDTDYSDPLEEEYVDLDELKKASQYKVLGSDKEKKLNKFYDGSRYQGTGKNFGLGDGLSEDEEEIDEDYDDNEDGLDEFTYLKSSNLLQPETAKNSIDANNLKGSDYVDDLVYSTSNAYAPKSKDLEYNGVNFEQLGYNNPEGLKALEPNAQQIILSDSKNNPQMGKSSNVLMKANEDANILGKNLAKNLAKNLMKYNYDGAMNDDQLLENNLALKKYHESELLSREKPKICQNEWKNKLKRSQSYSPIGNRFYYDSKPEFYDSESGSVEIQLPYRRNSNKFLAKRNPLNAELKGAESEFEYESERSNKHFISNLANGENEEESEEDKSNEESNTYKRNSDLEPPKNSRESKLSNSGDVDDRKDNLKNDSETIADDDILENVIGKYIMRKSVKVKPERNLEKHWSDTEESASDFEEQPNSEDAKEHKRKKKSLENDSGFEKFSHPKTWRKRLSSGHLTEKNYQKFHKKIFFNKRHAKTLTGTDHPVESSATDDLSPAANQNTKPKNDFKKINKNFDSTWTNQNKFTENAKQRKRSLNIFKKMSGKDKEDKKEESNVNAIGFEPIFQSPDSKNEVLTSKKQEEFERNEEPLDKVEAHKSNDGVAGSSEKTIFKLESSDDRISKIEGPWKIELNEKCDEKMADRNSKDGQNILGTTNTDKGNLKQDFNSDDKNQNLKAYLVIRKHVRSLDRSQNPAAEALSPTSGASEREVGNSYLPKCEKGLGYSKIRLRKESEDCASSNVHLISFPEISLTKPETNRALRNRKSPSGADSIIEAPYTTQRNTEKNSSLVNSREQRQNSGNNRKLLSNGRKKRKSVFSFNSNANIREDDSHVDEEASEFLGQQIVEAILTHVSNNPKFKEVIAPGLSGKSSTRFNENFNWKRVSKGADYSEKVHSLIQKAMLDIEKIAEQHVKKRMCNKIDEKSKEFLYNLLEVPAESSNSNFRPFTNFCPDKLSASPYNASKFSETENLNSFSENSLEKSNITAKICDTLNKKRDTILKLIKEYQKLSDEENETFNVNFQYLKSKLENTNRLLSSFDRNQGCSGQNFLRSEGVAKTGPDRLLYDEKKNGLDVPFKFDKETVRSKASVRQNKDEAFFRKKESHHAVPTSNFFQAMDATTVTPMQKTSEFISSKSFETVTQITGTSKTLNLLPDRNTSQLVSYQRVTAADRNHYNAVVSKNTTSLIANLSQTSDALLKTRESSCKSNLNAKEGLAKKEVGRQRSSRNRYDGFADVSFAKDVQKIQSSILPEEEREPNFYRQNLFDEFPFELRRKLQDNKKGFYPKPERRISIHSLLKHLQDSPAALKTLQLANRDRKTPFRGKNEQKTDIEKLLSGGFFEIKKKSAKATNSLGKT